MVSPDHLLLQRERSMADVVLSISVLAAGALVVLAAVSDIRTMTIPNRIPLAVTGLFAIAMATGVLPPVEIGLHVVVGVALFCLGVALFAAGLFGGGDAKLMPAVALFMGPAGVTAFIVHMAIAGGVLALAFLVVRRIPMPAGVRERPWVARLMAPNGGIPYGIAIAAGAIAAAPHAPLVMRAFS